jgi:hypothetical protein
VVSFTIQESSGRAFVQRTRSFFVQTITITYKSSTDRHCMSHNSTYQTFYRTYPQKLWITMGICV